jgi:hypothetical protein
MSYAVLMAYVDPDRMPEQQVRLAAHLANKFNAALIGLSALAIRGPVECSLQIRIQPTLKR